MKKILSLFLFSILYIAQAQEILKYEEHACLTDPKGEEECSTIELSFPIFDHHLWLNEFIVKNLIGDKDFKPQEDLKAQIDIFLKETVQSMIEFDPDFNSIETQFLGQTIIAQGGYQNYVALLDNNETYFKGAAHGNSQQTFYLLDTMTQKIIGLDEILVDKEAKIALAALQYEALREVFKEYEINIDDHFDNGSWAFFSTQNFTPTQNGITFLYNQYEIGPYALGPIEITISAKELQGIIKEAFIHVLQNWQN